MSSPDLQYVETDYRIPEPEAQQIPDFYYHLEHSETAHNYFSPSHHITFDDANGHNEDHDIYRGEPPPEPPSTPRTPRPPSVASHSSSSSSGSSSSSDSSMFGGRLGAISTIVERAISHWARAWVSSSSLSDSSSSSSSPSRSSAVNASRSIISRRRRRRFSVADIHNARSEWEIHARIKAREEARQVPREFLLYSPRLGEATAQKTARKSRAVDVGSEPLGVLRTTVLPLILQELSKSMKTTARSRRSQESSSLPSPASYPSSGQSSGAFDGLRFRDFALPPVEPLGDYRPPLLEDARTRRRGRKGKHRDAPVAPLMTRDISDGSTDKAWWLDVANPTWEDMRAIGKLLHLHPLTLEDILVQESREKLELFPKLGYYLVVFRAIESEKSRHRRRLIGTLNSNDTRDELRDEGILEAVNVYLVVFKEGICTFHFSDISDHTDVVRNKIQSLTESAMTTMSADWIAHGIMDSIVDSFFPLLEQVEKEMIHLENVMFSDGNVAIAKPMDDRDGDQLEEKPMKRGSGSDTLTSHSRSSSSSFENENKSLPTQQKEKATTSVLHAQFAVPKRRIMTIRYIKHLIRRIALSVPRFNFKLMQVSRGKQVTHRTVNRIARVRRLVTSLSRILASKSEVVAQVKKRLLMTGESGLSHDTGNDNDVYIYLGDVQDHILTLQQSLAHYERMLSQSHPIYLSHLRLSVSASKSGSDKAIAMLTMVSMAVLVMQVVIGFNSMNVTLPHDERGAGRFHVFGTVIAACVGLLFLYGCIVRYWWVSSSRKRSWS
ncbi:hypothetical protein BDY19DRAFT_914959 [Irpex rosettiformis]|uniref:Uncharacterized protein n=1 Tax=Irpex rosettiformis TaxID=378272 RepID=A0ACB8UKF3_9APHY|nr:hypothetical protein BDY19DRAFT_914959 [Irpex rosettiformis]